MSGSVHLVGVFGGEGTRLWPLTAREPKQYLTVPRTSRSFAEETVDRFIGVIPPGNVWAATDLSNSLRIQQLLRLTPERMIVEPARRGTAAAFLFAALRVVAEDEDAIIVGASCDHQILNVPKFQRAIRTAIEAARAGFLVQVGIEPSYASTGSGWMGPRAEPEPGYSGFGHAVHRVEEFETKPELERAQTLLAKRWLWSAGIYAWRARTFIGEACKCFPELRQIRSEFEQGEVPSARVWEAVPIFNVDAAVSERTNLGAVVPTADLGWADIGTLPDYFKCFARLQGDGNRVLGPRVHIGRGGRNVGVINATSSRVETAGGVHDLMVVYTPLGLLVASPSGAQEVRAPSYPIEHIGSNVQLMGSRAQLAMPILTIGLDGISVEVDSDRLRITAA